jgi:hypothetical protein
VVEAPQPLDKPAGGAVDAEARIGQGVNIFEEREPALERCLVATPVGHHIAKHKQVDRAQQKSI